MVSGVRITVKVCLYFRSLTLPIKQGNQALVLIYLRDQLVNTVLL